MPERTPACVPGEGIKLLLSGVPAGLLDRVADLDGPLIATELGLRAAPYDPVWVGQVVVGSLGSICSGGSSSLSGVISSTSAASRCASYTSIPRVIA